MIEPISFLGTFYFVVFFGGGKFLAAYEQKKADACALAASNPGAIVYESEENFDGTFAPLTYVSCWERPCTDSVIKLCATCHAKQKTLNWTGKAKLSAIKR